MQFSFKAVMFAMLALAASVTARPSADDVPQQAPRRSRGASFYHQHGGQIQPEARGSETEEGLEYYGGASGNVLTVDPVHGPRPVKVESPAAEDDDVGEEPDPPKPPVGASPGVVGDTVVISQPPPGASVAEARPIGVAIAGVGGVASAAPVGTAVVGPGGLAVSRPVATAIAGVQLTEGTFTGLGIPQPAKALGSGEVETREAPTFVMPPPLAFQGYVNYYPVGPIFPGPQGPLFPAEGLFRGVQYGTHRPDEANSPSYVHKPTNTQPTKPALGLPIYGYVPPQTNDEAEAPRGVLVGPGALQGTNTFYESHPVFSAPHYGDSLLQPIAYGLGQQYPGVQYAYDTANSGPQVIAKEVSHNSAPMHGYVPTKTQPTGQQDEKLSVAVGPEIAGAKYSILPLQRSEGPEGIQHPVSSYSYASDNQTPFSQVIYHPLVQY